ncbi:MAG: PEP-CTERM sorting domain-containing protein [Armatimonas sp.]
MKNVGFLALSGLAVVLLAPGFASAQTLIFDNSAGTNQGNSQRVPNGQGLLSAPLAQITIGATPKTISNIAVDVNLSGTGNIKFLIFDGNASGPSSTLLYSSAAKSFGAGQQWAMSDAFSFTLQANTTYYVGGIADISGFWYLDDTVVTQSGITSVKPNGNVSNFATPARVANGPGSPTAQTDIHVQLFTGAPVAMPEPGTLALLGLGAVGFGISRRRVKTT